jgi:hypothetical protein
VRLTGRDADEAAKVEAEEIGEIEAADEEDQEVPS